MKKLNNKFARTLTAAVVVAGAAAMLSVGAFAAEDDGIIAGYMPPQEQMIQGDIALYAAEEATPVLTDDVTIAGYMPPQEEMIQGDIALHSVDYAAPVGDAIQGDIMLISAGDLTTTLPSDTLVEKSQANYTMKGLFGKQVLYTARQEGRVLTLTAPDDNAIFRTTIQDMQTLLNEGVSTLVVTTGKTSTTLNLTLLVEGQSQSTKVVLRHLGDNAFLTVGLRCRRDLLIGR